MALETCCTITVIICSYMLLTPYVREANVEPHASPSLFYAYYGCGPVPQLPAFPLMLFLYLSLPPGIMKR